ncbi:LamG domain-containing protein [Streptomyces sp. ME02-8801-2C]|uniref:LamG domain-containing protein n=1 Tax=Streptomyces sp. ME02-8801-2C TaxID=3028680 RepID=UPI0029B67D28|nr:LamG domain-containing protein [Streptomyces sp. ME02-8801-2C]MDX3457244.1 LamG domain-containing protein [Streptomyces sp. ME02-8801-2C]
MLVAGLLATLPVASATDASAAPRSESADASAETEAEIGAEDAALAEAKRTGKDVEVAALRSETREVYAKPSGVLEAAEHLRPVRTRVDGAWKKIDTSLRERADGTLAPVAAAVGIAFSGGGGQQPLITLEKAGRELSLSWPTALPEPVVVGATATYPAVLPGVDLQVRADIDGISQLLIVKSAEAAANPQLDELRLAMDADGMTVSETANGGLAATDSGAGGEVFEAPQPLMWDSSASGKAAATTARTAALRDAAAGAEVTPGPGESAQVAPIDVEIAAGGTELVLTPDQELLEDAVYPVYIDPLTYTPKAGNWTMVSRYWASSPQWRFNGDSDAGMGYCAGDARCAPEDVKRLFYAIPTSGFAGKEIVSAEFIVKETHSYSCDKTDVQLYRTKGISQSTTWNSQAAEGFWTDLLQTRSEAKGWSGDCPGGNLEFWALRAVQQAAANGWATTTFGLRAKSETDRLAWKRFGDDAWLRVQYNRPPGQIRTSQLTQKPGGVCSSTPQYVRIRPEVRANNVTDPDRDSVAVRFQAWWDPEGPATVSYWTSSLSTYKSSGSDFSITLPSSIPSNRRIGWHAQAFDGNAWSPWSSAGSATSCAFVYDTSAPAEPSITSTQYPESNLKNPNEPWVDGVGRYGTFTIDSTATDVTKYWFGINTNPTSAHTLTTSGGGAKTMKFMPTKSGVNFITAQAFDSAGNNSSPAIYHFRVRSGQPDRAKWDLDEGAGASAVSGQGSEWPAVLSATGAVVGGEGVSGTGLHLDGASGEASTTSPVVNTAKSFSVSLWAKLPGANPGGAPVAIAQAGHQTSGFEIYYSSTLGGWVFLRHSADASSGVTAVRATQPACGTGDSACTAARLGQWTHLVGVFDNTAGQLRLYVNGKLVATTAFTGAWDSRAGLHLGANAISGVSGNFFAGDLDEAQLFDYQLTDAQVTTLHNKNPVASGGRPAKAVWPLDEAAPTNTVTGRAQKISASLHGGTVLGRAGVDGGALNLNGTDGYAVTGQPLLDTYQSFAVSLWARLPKDKDARPMVAASQGSDNQRGFELYHSSALGGWVFQRATADITEASVERATYAACPANTNCAAGQLGEWAHVVGVYDIDAAQMRLYVNGVLRASQPFTTTWMARGPVSLGAAAYPNGMGGFLKGDLDDVRMYDRVISDDEVRALFKQHPVVKGRWKLESASGNPVVSPDSSAQNRPATLHNGAKIGAAWVDSGALVLDGDTEYAATGSVPIDTSQSFTVTAWALAPSGRPQETGVVLSQAGAVNSAFTVGYEPGPDDGDPSTPIATGRWRIRMPDADSTDAGEATASSRLFDEYSANGWNHLALVYDAFADQMKLYVNGQLQQFVCADDNADGTQDDPACTDNVSWADNTVGFNATKTLEFGRAKTAGVWGDNWSGAIDDVWAFQGALDQGQIQQLALGTADFPTTVPGSG